MRIYEANSDQHQHKYTSSHKWVPHFHETESSEERTKETSEKQTRITDLAQSRCSVALNNNYTQTLQL